LSLLLRFAQISSVKKTNNNDPVFLIDDLTSELDENNSRRILELITNLSNQVFITSRQSEPVFRDFSESAQVFHVEHGVING
jgi:DNA replication and repair protein RecF